MKLPFSKIKEAFKDRQNGSETLKESKVHEGWYEKRWSGSRWIELNLVVDGYLDFQKVSDMLEQKERLAKGLIVFIKQMFTFLEKTKNVDINKIDVSPFKDLENLIKILEVKFQIAKSAELQKATKQELTPSEQAAWVNVF